MTHKQNLKSIVYQALSPGVKQTEASRAFHLMREYVDPSQNLEVFASWLDMGRAWCEEIDLLSDTQIETLLNILKVNHIMIDQDTESLWGQPKPITPAEFRKQTNEPVSESTIDEAIRYVDAIRDEHRKIVEGQNQKRVFLGSNHISTFPYWMKVAQDEGYGWVASAWKNWCDPNLRMYDRDSLYSDLAGAISEGFQWNPSPEGQDYWETVCDSLSDPDVKAGYHVPAQEQDLCWEDEITGDPLNWQDEALNRSLERAHAQDILDKQIRLQLMTSLLDVYKGYGKSPEFIRECFQKLYTSLTTFNPTPVG